MVSENVRISFSKTGRLKYISHLDLCRTFYTAMIRAKLPLKYTEGFNPHPKMVFTQPLPLFAESRCELLDIRLTEAVPHDEICRRLRAQFTDELYVNKVYEPDSMHGKFSDIAYASYVLTGFENTDAEKLEKLLSGEINVLKRNKKGEEKETDIRPLVRSLEISHGDTPSENRTLAAVLSASADAYLNPDVLCRALSSALCEPSPAGDSGNSYGIVRTGWYRNDMSMFE